MSGVENKLCVTIGRLLYPMHDYHNSSFGSIRNYISQRLDNNALVLL